MAKTMIEVTNDWKKIRSNLGTLINGIDEKINDAEYQQRKVDEAYQRGYHQAEIDCNPATAYQKGLEDAWEAAMKLSIMTPEEAEKVFTGAEKYNRFNLGYSGAEAVKKLKAYEEQKKSEEEADIKVGDWVKDDGGLIGIVTFCNKINDHCDVMWRDGAVGENWPKDNLTKLGRPSYPMADLLRGMFEDEDKLA